jgi:hypothetical protein
MTFSTSIHAWLLLVPLIPSTIVSVFNLYHILSSRALRKALNNHVFIVLLICGLIEEVTDISWLINIYRTGTVLSSTKAYCFIWASIGPSLFVSNFILMAWASIERHIIIFYPNWFATKTKRLFFHYLPLATCILWPTTFYLVTFFIVPCDVPLKFGGRYCGRYACIPNNSLTGKLDSALNYIVPTFSTVIFSVALFARVVYTRYRIRGRIDWRNYKKMALQLLPISILHLALQFPPYLLYAAYTGGLSSSVGSNYYTDGIFFTYWVILFTPFATVLSLPELKTKCKQLLFWRRRRAVQPEMLAMTRRNVGQTIAVVPVEAGRATVAPAVMTAAAVATTAMAPAAEAKAPTAEATAPAAEAMVSAAEATAPTAEAMVSAAEATAPTAEATIPTAEATIPTAEATIPTAEATAPAAEATAPTAEAMVSAAEATAPPTAALGAMISTSMAPAAMRSVEMPPIDI